MRRLTALLLGMVLAVCSMAQVTMPDTYRLQPEDLLRIQVYAQGTDLNSSWMFRSAKMATSRCRL
jgi:protein involved in polysaccharide export with SLBB domain